MRVLDLFAGLGGWSAAFRDRGHDVVTLDLDPRFGCTITGDVLQVRDLSDLEGDRGPFDVVLASPPCEAFSTLMIGRNWRIHNATGHVSPKNARTSLGLRIALHTFALVAHYAPRWYAIENPRGMLRRVSPRPPTTTTWYCRWGETRAKPTDLWTNVRAVPEWPTCTYGGTDHESSPRGQTARRYGLVQGGVVAQKSAAERSLIPYALSLAFTRACETDGRIVIDGAPLAFGWAS